MSIGPIRAYSREKEGEKKISPHFRVREFACKDGSDVVFVAEKLVEVLEALRVHFGKSVRITSGYRTPSHNKKEGGATYSQHLYGLAADIKISGIKPKDVAAYAEKLLPDRGGIGIYKNFVHVDVRVSKTRWQG